MPRTPRSVARMQRILDIDLDFFVNGAAHWVAYDGDRLEPKEFRPWPLEDAIAFLRIGMRADPHRPSLASAGSNAGGGPAGGHPAPRRPLTDAPRPRGYCWVDRSGTIAKYRLRSCQP